MQVKNETLVFARVLNDKYALVALNNTPETKHMEFDYDGFHYEFDLEPHGSKILR